MDRLALLIAFVGGIAFGKGTSPETRRAVRWWLVRVAKGESGRRIDIRMSSDWTPPKQR